MLLYSIVQGSLALNILSIDIGSVAEEELAELHTLDAVDETGAAVKIWFLNVGIVVDQELHDVEVGHEAGGPDGSGARVRHAVDVRAVPHQHVHHAVLAGYAGAP